MHHFYTNELSYAAWVSNFRAHALLHQKYHPGKNLQHFSQIFLRSFIDRLVENKLEIPTPLFLQLTPENRRRLQMLLYREPLFSEAQQIERIQDFTREELQKGQALPQAEIIAAKRVHLSLKAYQTIPPAHSSAERKYLQSIIQKGHTPAEILAQLLQ